MAVVTYPFCRTVDDSGAILTGCTVAIASVVDKTGSAVAGHGATVNVAGSCVSVDYDAATHGDAWVILSISKAGSTITSENAAPAAYLTSDPSRLAAYLDASVSSRLAVATDVSGAQTLGTVGDALRKAYSTLDAAVSTVNTAVGAISTTIGVAGAGLTGIPKTGFKLASDGVDAVMIESGINLRQAMSLDLAASAGVISGAGTTTVTIKGAGVVTTRIVATVDSSGNRSTITLTPST